MQMALTRTPSHMLWPVSGAHPSTATHWKVPLRNSQNQKQPFLGFYISLITYWGYFRYRKARKVAKGKAELSSGRTGGGQTGNTAELGLTTKCYRSIFKDLASCLNLLSNCLSAWHILVFTEANVVNDFVIGALGLLVNN